jgi:hypothetical protein
MRVKIAVLAPIPRASERIATPVSMGVRINARMAYFTSKASPVIKFKYDQSWPAVCFFLSMVLIRDRRAGLGHTNHVIAELGMRAR